MKTFKDLIFKDHIYYEYFDKSAVIHFNNKYGISVINGKSAYCTKNTYEVAILYNGELCYDTELTDDVLSNQTPNMITNVMTYLQNL